jgi:hypothetical protein
MLFFSYYEIFASLGHSHKNNKGNGGEFPLFLCFINKVAMRI